MQIKYCRNCCDMVLHDEGMCTRCTFISVGNVVPKEVAVRCPVCLSFFFFQEKDPKGDRHEFVGDDDHAPPDVDRGGFKR